MSSNKSCAVKSCRSENRKLFRCPESRSQLRKWKNAVGTSERDFYVCELHFDAHFVNYEKVLSNEAVPTLFINENLRNISCATCSSPMSEGHQVSSLHREIYRMLFINSELISGYICTCCNDQIIRINDFIKIVEENRRNFEFLDVEMKEPTIKLEPEEYGIVADGLSRDILFIKTEEEQNDSEQEMYLEELTSRSKRSKRCLSPHAALKKQKSYKCEVCFLTISGKNEFTEHIKSIHSVVDDSVEDGTQISDPLHGTSQSIECDICREIFSDKKLLIEHFKEHFNKQKPLKCSECNKTYNGINVLAFHKNCEHKDGNRFYCICCRIFDNEFDMRQCRKNHKMTISSNEHVCSECDSYKAFENVRKLACHKTKVHGNGKRFWCIGCGKQHVSKEANLKCRRRHYSPLKSVIVRCPECDKKIAYDSLKTHQLAVHSGIRNEICDQCGKAFPLKSQLSSHMKYFHGKKDEKEVYECDLCPLTYKSKGSIFTHVNQNHNPEKKMIQCPICLKKMFNMLDAHIRNVHPNNYDNGVRVNPESNKYHCPNCIRRFGGMKQFEIHVRDNICSNFGKYEVDETKKLTVFTQGKFTCNICNRIKSSMIKLRIHMSDYHSAPQTCPVCNKVLKNRRQMHKHVYKVHKTSMKQIKSSFGT